MERFWSKVQVSNESSCWEWLASKVRGYGQFWYNGKQVKAHRMAWMLVHDNIDDTLFLCHKCDNPSCVNPNHLFLGTPKDNTRDMISKNRKVVVSGEQHPWFKVAPENHPSYGRKHTEEAILKMSKPRTRGNFSKSVHHRKRIGLANKLRPINDLFYNWVAL